MTLREYRPINLSSKMPRGQIEENKTNLHYLFSSIEDLKPYHCLYIDGYALIKSDIVQNESIISVKNPDKKKKEEDILQSYPKHLYSAIKKLNEELNLTINHLNKLKKEMETAETKQLKIAEQVKLLTREAYNLRKKTDNQNFINNFRNRYSKLNESLSSELKELNPKIKNEFLILLNDLKSRIDEVSPYLTEK